MSVLNSQDSERLINSKILWISTVSKNLTPHLVPVWHVLDHSKIYICIGKHSVKFHNIKGNHNVASALEDGINPLAGTGRAVFRNPNVDQDKVIIQKFKEKYDWDISTDKDYTMLVEIEISKLFMRKNNENN